MTILPVNIILPLHFWQPALMIFVEDYAHLGYIIKRGFITDGATVPWFLWWLFPPLGKYARAAALHVAGMWAYEQTGCPSGDAGKEIGGTLVTDHAAMTGTYTAGETDPCGNVI